MKYIVECRKKDENGEITGVCFKGFGNGLPDKKMGKEIFNREITSGKWDAVYLDKVTAKGISIDVEEWYKKN